MNKSDDEPVAHDTSPDPAMKPSMHDEQEASGLGLDETPVELTSDLNTLSAEEKDHRRRALRSMLAANEARQNQMKRSRPPTITAGVRVAIKSGPHRDKRGVILDADYIHSRALIDFADGANGHWIEFGRITSDSNGS